MLVQDFDSVYSLGFLCYLNLNMALQSEFEWLRITDDIVSTWLSANKND